MKTPVPEPLRVIARHGHVEVEGMDEQDVKDAIHLFRAAISSQVEARNVLATNVMQIMRQQQIPLVSDETQRQIQRSAALREELLTEHGAYTYATLAQVRNIGESSIRAWVSRLRQQDKIFTVDAGGKSLVPKVILSNPGSIDEAIAALVQPLLRAGLDGWSLWAWLLNPTGLLSGAIPADVVRENPARARKAAARYASELLLQAHDMAK